MQAQVHQISKANASLVAMAAWNRNSYKINLIRKVRSSCYAHTSAHVDEVADPRFFFEFHSRILKVICFDNIYFNELIPKLMNYIRRMQVKIWRCNRFVDFLTTHTKLWSFFNQRSRGDILSKTESKVKKKLSNLVVRRHFL